MHDSLSELQTHQSDLSIIISQTSPTPQPIEASKQQDQPSQQSSLVSFFVDSAKQIQSLIDKKQEPVDLLREFNHNLDSRFEEIMGHFEQTNGSQAKYEFYSVVLKGTANKFLNEKIIANPNYLIQILRFFRNILVNFFPRDLGDENLSDIVHSMFNLDAHLYTVALQSGNAKSDLTQSGSNAILQIFNNFKNSNQMAGLNQDNIQEQDGINTNSDPLHIPPELNDVLLLEQKRLISEFPWRQSLKVGDRLDVVLSNQVSATRVQQWVPATIYSLTSSDYMNMDYSNQEIGVDFGRNQKFMVVFDNFSISEGRKICSRNSYEIAPLGTFTNDFDWKYSLQKGDLVDCMDSEGTWYRSTVLDTREFPIGQINHDGNERKQYEVYIGYRYYNEEEGHKTDEEGRKFVGWSNKYDAWINNASPTIQKLNTVSKHYKVAGRSTMSYDIIGINDDSDIISNSNERKIWALPRLNFFQNLKCISDYLNEFGSRGGFDNILELFSNSNQNISLKHIFFLMEFLSKTLPLWHRQFAVDYIQKLRFAFERVFLSSSITNKFNKDHFSGAHKCFVQILKRYYTSSPSTASPKTMDDNYHLLSSDIIFTAACKLLLSEKLEQRVAGLKEINEQLKNTRFGMMRRGLSDKELVDRLHQYNALEQVFAGKETHVQLVQRGEELLRFLIDQRAFNEPEIEIVWNAAQRGDEQTKLEFYKQLESVSIKFKNDDIALLIDKFTNSIAPERFMRQEIECVSKLTQFCQRMTNASLKACKLFWDIACKIRPYPNEIIENALDKLTGLLTSQEYSVKIQFLNDSNEQMQHSQSALQSIRIMQKIMDMIPSYRQNNNLTAYEVAQSLIGQYQIIAQIIVDLSRYSEAANAEWERGIINKDNIESVEMLGLPFTHRSNIYTRLNFIRQLLHQSQSQLESIHQDQIWEILITNSKISVDQVHFFEWFKGLLAEQNRVGYELISSFFESRVCKMTQFGSFKEIRKAGFDCIQNMFLMINEQEDKLHIISLPSNQANNQAKLDFLVQVPPSQLRGIEVIWGILQDCDKKNMDLTAPVIDLITKLYHNISEQLTQNQVFQIQDAFCKECIHQMKVISANSNVSDEEKKQFIKTIAIMIKSFLQDSERNGAANLRNHTALDRGEFLEKIILQNQITQLKSVPRLIEVNTYSNMTVWELKKIAASKFKISPRRIDLKRSDLKKMTFDDNHNSKLLRDIKLESFEVISAYKKPVVNYARVPLLNKKKELVPEAKAVFSQWFDMFSVDDVMNPDNCIEFIRFTTNVPEAPITIKDDRIVLFFNTYNKNNDGKLTREEFLEFYRERSETKPEVVWSNLSHAKYGNDLKPLNETLNADDPKETKEIHNLPRCKLSTDQNLFGELIEILRDLPVQAQDEIWQLIIQLRTNPNIYCSLLSLEGLSDLTNKSENLSELLYSLQIIDSFINEFQIKREPEIRSYYSENKENDQFPALNDAINQINTNSNRDAQPQAPESGKAIPLPPAGANIPIPPQIPFIGPTLPPPGSNNNGSSSNSTGLTMEQVLEHRKKINDLLDQFKQNSIVEPANDSVIEDQEIAKIIKVDIQQVAELRSNWVQRFIHKGGFSVILQILFNLNAKTQKYEKADVLKAKIEKDCWNQILKIVKILLMSTFVAKHPIPELSLALQRRMSSQAEQLEGKEEEKKEQQSSQEKKNKIMIDQEATAEQYEPLVQIMQSETGQIVIDQIDLSSFQELILQIIQLVLTKKDTIGIDDRQIIEQGISIWISCIVFNQGLLQHVYNEAQQNDSKTSITKILIEDGLLCSNMTVRTLFRDSIKFLAESVKSEALSQQPFSYFLVCLLQAVDITENKPKDSKQFYQLLKSLLHLYLDGQKQSLKQGIPFKELFEHKHLLDQYVHRLVNYKSQERKGSFYQEDNNLIGILQFIDELIKSDPECISSEEQNALTNEVISKCLFTIELEPLLENITKNVDISAFEKPQLNKCSSVMSRKAAYQLLQTLCNINPLLVSTIINVYLQPVLMRVKKPKKSGFQPRLEYRANGFCGLKNLGCICYMNSMLQQFFNVPTFRYSLLSVQDNVPQNLVPFEGDQVDDNILHQLMKLMGFLELSERQEYNPREFCFSFKDFDGNPTNVRLQQDTQEFLNVAFDRLENHLSKTSQKYLLQNVFGGQTCSVMICKSCGNIRQTFEQFFNLSLEVQNQRNVYDGLRRLTTGELINQFNCEACGQKVDVEKKTVIDKLPNMLIIHLQRIVFDMDTFMNKKLNSRIEFPNILNLKSYMTKEVLKEERKQMQIQKQEKGQVAETVRIEEGKAEEDGKEQEQQVQVVEEQRQEEDGGDKDMSEEEPKENFDYKLVGVVLHMGTADAGHYLSYININRGEKDEESPEWLQTEKEKWLEFNDSTVREYRFSNLETDCFGGEPNYVAGESLVDYSKNAYMLVYEKRRKEPIKVIIPQQSIVQTNDSDGQAISQVPEFTKLCPEINLEKAHDLKLHYDETKNEYYSLVDFNAIQKFVPNSLYQMVHNDNHTFLFERQIFNAGFFEAIKELLEIMLQNNPEALLENNPESESLFLFMDKLIFDLLIMTSENKQLIDLTKIYIRMLDLNPTQTINLINRRIIIQAGPDGKDSQNQKEYFECLVSNMDKDVREVYAMILLQCVNKCFQTGMREIIDQVMGHIFALLPEDIAKNWLKCHQYLWFLYELTKSGPDQMRYMIENKLITKLIDFFLENDSPAVTISKGKRRQVMGSNYAIPPLDSLILCISYICRCQKFIDLKGSNADFGNPESGMINGYQKWSPICFYSCMDENEHPNYPALSNDDKYMLQQKAFIDKGLKSNYQPLEFSRLMAHLSFENYDFSKKLSKRILYGINKANPDETLGFIAVIGWVLCFQDTIFLSRLEWILGVPQPKWEKQISYQNSSQVSQKQLSYKMGTSVMSNALDDAFEYRSTLFKTSSQVKECYLQILYQHRKTWPKFTVDCLISLFQTCLTSQSGSFVYHYLYTMEPPTYAHGRYLDWVYPFLKDHMSTCLRNANIQSYNNELQLTLQAVQLFQKLISTQSYSGELVKQVEDLNKSDQIVGASSQKRERRPYQYDVQMDHGSNQYVILSVNDERLMRSPETRYDEKIEITVKELQVRITGSLPDGFTNQAVPQDQYGHQNNFGRSNINNGGIMNNNTNSSQWGKNPQHGRGAGVHYQVKKTQGGTTIMSANTRRPDSHMKNKKRKNQGRNNGVAFSSGMNNDDQLESLDYVDENYVSDREELNSHEHVSEDANAMEVEQSNERTQEPTHDLESGIHSNSPAHGSANNPYFPSNNQIQNQDDGPGHQSAPELISPQDIRINSQPLDTEFNVPGGIVPQVSGNNQDQQPDEDQQMIQDDIENQNSWEALDWAVIVISISNLDNFNAQKVTLHLEHDLPRDANGNFNTIMPNMRLPISGIPLQLMAGRDREFILTKLKYFEDWTPYKLRVTVGKEPEAAVPIIDAPFQAPEPGNEMMIIDDIQEDVNACGTCTFHNSLTATQCEMCGSNLK